MHALAEFGVFAFFRQEVASRALVARFPRRAAIGCMEYAGGGNADPELPPVVRMKNQRMQDQPAAARLPVRPRRMIAQAGDVVPGLAGIVAAKQSRRLDTGVKASRALCHAPDRLDRL